MKYLSFSLLIILVFLVGCGGSSGSPWIQDFGFRPKGAPGVPFGGNLVVAVNSYGPASNRLLYNGASQLDDRFIHTFNAACAAAAGNC